MQIIDVPGVGEVEFPDDMDDASIGAAIQQMTGAAPAAPDLQASHADPASQAMSAHGNPQPEQMGAGQALLRRAAQGVLGGYGDELGGAVHAVLGSGGTMKDRYLTARDSERRKDDAAKEASPTGLGFAAETAGAIANPLSRGKSLLAALGAGAAFGYGNSRAKDVKGQLVDTATGAAFGGAGQQIGKGLGALAQKAPDALRRAGVALGYRHLRARGGDISARKPLDPDAIIAAYEGGAFRPGTTVHFAAEKLANLRNRLGKRVGDLEDEFAAAGVEGPEREALAREFAAEADRLQYHTAAGDPRKAAMSAEAADLRGEIPPPPGPPPSAPAPNSVPPNAPGGAANPWRPPPPPAAPPSRMNIHQALDKKRSAQWQAQEQYDTLAGKLKPSGEAKMEVAGRYKNAIDREIQRQGPTAAPDTYAEWAPTNKRFSLVAKADEVAQEGSARAKGRNWWFNAPNMTGAGVGGLGSIVTGNPLPLIAGLGVHALRTRGGSTGTWAALTADKALRSNAGTAARGALAADPTQRLIRALTLAGVPDDSNQ